MSKKKKKNRTEFGPLPTYIRMPSGKKRPKELPSTFPDRPIECSQEDLVAMFDAAIQKEKQERQKQEHVSE